MKLGITMEKWIYLELNGHDGAELEIILPFKTEYTIEKTQLKGDTYCIFFFRDTKFELDVSNRFMADSLEECIKLMFKSFRYFQDWHSKASNAPAENLEIYTEKIKIAHRKLLDLYGEEFPHLFV